MSEEQKVALVTGSSSGIGEATVKLLASKGYRVVVTGSNKEKVDRVVAECATASTSKEQPLGLVLDFKDPSNGELAVKKTIEHFGRLDVLVNNAGIFTRTLPTDANAYEDYKTLMNINLDATVKATLAAVDELKKNKGTIIMVSSVASFKPSERGYAYCMSKSAMTMFAKCLAIDLAPDVRVNVVSPGPVETPIFERAGISLATPGVKEYMSITTLYNRIGNPDEIASCVGFLCSPEASFINGHELVVDGGYVIKPSSTSASQAILALKKHSAQSSS